MPTLSRRPTEPARLTAAKVPNSVGRAAVWIALFLCLIGAGALTVVMGGTF